jgi:hypothetical protein
MLGSERFVGVSALMSSGRSPWRMRFYSYGNARFLLPKVETPIAINRDLSLP